MFLLNRYVYYTVLGAPFIIFGLINYFRPFGAEVFFIGLVTNIVYQSIIVLERRRQVYRHKINVLTKNFEKSLADAKLEMQELALRNISKEIHDNIKMSLAVANLNLTSLHTAANETEKLKMIDTAAAKVNKAYDELSNLSFTLDTDIIKKEGLITALDKELDNIRRTNLLKVEFNVTGNKVFSEEKRQLLIFRIIQEALQNIITHAKAESVRVLIHYNEDTLELLVKDNGKGFDTSQIEKVQGAGLGNIKNRINALEGKLYITSKPGEGTAIQASIPYNSSKKKRKGRYRWYHHVIDFIEDRFS